MAEEIIKVLEYMLNNETLRTIGTAYIAYVAVIAILGIIVFVVALKSILCTMHKMRSNSNFRKW